MVRSNEECVILALREAERLEQQRDRRNRRVLVAGGGVLSAACLLVVAAALSFGDSASEAAPNAPMSLLASVFADGPYRGLGFFVAVAAFLGFAFTALLLRSRDRSRDAHLRGNRPRGA